MPKLTGKAGFAVHKAFCSKVAEEVRVAREAAGKMNASELQAIKEQLDKAGHQKRNKNNAKSQQAMMAALAQRRAPRRSKLV